MRGKSESVEFEDVVGRAVCDLAFRKRLLADVDSVIAERNMSPAEIAVLRRLKNEDFDKLAQDLAQQLSGGPEPRMDGRCAKATGY